MRTTSENVRYKVTLDRLTGELEEAQKKLEAFLETAEPNIGKTALLQVAGSSLWIEVEIVGARVGRYGYLDYKVKPVAGEGEAWHDADNILTQYVLKKGVQK